MSVDLSDLVELLRAEVDAPGDNSFTDAVDADWVNQLRSGFWETVLDGIMMGYQEVDGIVTPIFPVIDDLSREYQQLVIFYAGVRVVRNKLRTMGTAFRAKAGPVEYETQNSAQVLKSIMDELINKRNIILRRLSDLGSSKSYYVDMVISRDESLAFGDSWFTRY
jgi:hypothetical protein